MIFSLTVETIPTSATTLSPLTLWKLDLSLPWTTFWITPLIRRRVVNRQVLWCVWILSAWRSINSELTTLNMITTISERNMRPNVLEVASTIGKSHYSKVAYCTRSAPSFSCVVLTGIVAPLNLASLITIICYINLSPHNFGCFCDGQVIFFSKLRGFSAKRTLLV